MFISKVTKSEEPDKEIEEEIEDEENFNEEVEEIEEFRVNGMPAIILSLALFFLTVIGLMFLIAYIHYNENFLKDSLKKCKKCFRQFEFRDLFCCIRYIPYLSTYLGFNKLA